MGSAVRHAIDAVNAAMGITVARVVHVEVFADRRPPRGVSPALQLSGPFRPGLADRSRERYGSKIE